MKKLIMLCAFAVMGSMASTAQAIVQLVCKTPRVCVGGVCYDQERVCEWTDTGGGGGGGGSPPSGGGGGGGGGGGVTPMPKPTPIAGEEGSPANPVRIELDAICSRGLSARIQNAQTAVRLSLGGLICTQNTGQGRYYQVDFDNGGAGVYYWSGQCSISGTWLQEVSNPGCAAGNGPGDIAPPGGHIP